MKIITIISSDAPLTTPDGRCVFCGYEHMGRDC